MSNPRAQCSGSSFELKVVMMSESDFVQHKMETERPDLLYVVGSSNFGVWWEFCKATRDEFHRFKQIAALPGGRCDRLGYMGELRIAIQVAIETRHRQSSANSTASVAENTHRGVNEDDIDDESSEEGRAKRRRCNFIRPRTPGTIGLSEVMPLHPGETSDQYFERFENTWEPDPDRPGLVRRKAAEDVEDAIRRDQEEFPTTIQVRRGDIDPEFDSARQFNKYTTLADDTSEALPDIDTHPREEAPILVESSSEDSE